MQATIAEILDDPGAFADAVVNVDGILLISGYERSVGEFGEVLLLQQDAPRSQALRAQPISSASTLWHGLSRLNPRHLPGFQSYRVHDVARARVQVAAPRAAPQVEILSAAVYRHEFTLYVGAKGVRLDQCLPGGAGIRALADIRANIARHLGRRWHVYGTLVIRSAPPAQYLLPGRMPYADDSRSLAEQLAAGNDAVAWLEDIEYPQSDSQAPPDGALPESIHLDQAYRLREQLAALPGITQTVVKPAIVTGMLGARDHDLHFATLTDIEQVYLQNISYAADGKALESVLKLKNLAPVHEAEL